MKPIIELCQLCACFECFESELQVSELSGDTEPKRDALEKQTNKYFKITSQIESFSATQFGNSVTDTFASFSGNDIETCGVSLDASVNNVLFHVLRVISRAPTLRSTNGYRGRKDGLTVRAYQNACSTLKPSFVTSRAF